MSRFSRVFSAQMYQLQGIIITVEIDINQGMHHFTIVGLADKSVDESRERVGTALKHSGFSSPRHSNSKTTVALAPAEIRKEGSYFDIAIAIGYLLASKELSVECDDCVFVGELSLDGTLRPIRGALGLAQAAAKEGFKKLFVPIANADEASLVHMLEVYPIKNIKELVDHLEGTCLIMPHVFSPEKKGEAVVVQDLADVKGQEIAKRALEIAAAGGHNIALSGPPGTGKTMLARAMIGLLPDLSFEEKMEVTTIHSTVGINKGTIIEQPPLRCPHHTASYVSIIGGGSDVRPGEVTLAHRGVLFMDEFPEFDAKVLESLRQPIEDKVVTIARAKATVQYPAQFLLMVAMNPCPCGYAGSMNRTCICTPRDKARYARKLSGPMVDRIELWVSVEHVSFELLESKEKAESSETVRNRVLAARAIQENRAQLFSVPKLNSLLSAHHLDQLLVSEDARITLKNAAQKLSLSPRGYHRMLKLARTIADLEQSIEVLPNHILEALQYRPKF